MPRHHGRSHKHRSKRHSSSSDEEDDETSSSTPKYYIKWHKHRSRRHSSSSDDENEDFRAQLATLGLELRDVPADGNCMFHAFSDQLFGTTERHAQLRREAVDYLREHRRELLPFCAENEFDHEVDELAEPGTFGDHTSLLALSRKYDVDVVVHQVGLNPMYAVRIPSHDRQTRQVHLAFHDMMHYSSVRCRGDIGGRANVHIDPSKILPKPEKKKRKKK